AVADPDADVAEDQRARSDIADRRGAAGDIDAALAALRVAGQDLAEIRDGGGQTGRYAPTSTLNDRAGRSGRAVGDLAALEQADRGVFASRRGDDALIANGAEIVAALRAEFQGIVAVDGRGCVAIQAVQHGAAAVEIDAIAAENGIGPGDQPMIVDPGVGSGDANPPAPLDRSLRAIPDLTNRLP